MMPFLLSLHTVWSRLDDLQREQNARPRRSGLSPYASDMRPTTDYFDPGARVRCVRTALWMSKDRACGMLAERLSGINLSTVLGVLIAACEDVAVVWGGSVLVGGALGGVVGALGGGVGAVPGAAVGAGLGVQAGLWILGLLGLKSLIEDLGTAVPEVLRLYEQGVSTAWGTADDWGAFQWHDGDDFFRTQDAARQFAQGHVLLMVTLLSALLAYLTRGRGDPVARARILQEIRQSPRLGPKVADWVVANEEALARHRGLKPKERQVVMSQAKPPAEPPMTPSQLRKAAGGESGSPPPKPPAPPPPKPPPPPGPVGPSGKLPLSGADRAVIDHRKVTDYALNPEHPVGGNKAKVFESALGFKKENADDLIAQLKDGVKNNPAIEGKLDQFGQRYTVDIPVSGPTGSGVVRTGWIYKVGSDVPELTILFVK